MVENNKPVRVPEISISYVVMGEENQEAHYTLDSLKYRQPQDEVILMFEDEFGDLETQCKGDYIFVINSNEVPNEKMFDMLHFIFKMNYEDAFYIPRETYITYLTEEQITNNKWVKAEDGRINYPDWKKCIYKNNGIIKWKDGKLTGDKSHTYFPTVPEYNLKRTITLKEYIDEN